MIPNKIKSIFESFARENKKLTNKLKWSRNKLCKLKDSQWCLTNENKELTKNYKTLLENHNSLQNQHSRLKEQYEKLLKNPIESVYKLEKIFRVLASITSSSSEVGIIVRNCLNEFSGNFYFPTDEERERKWKNTK